MKNKNKEKYLITSVLIAIICLISACDSIKGIVTSTNPAMELEFQKGIKYFKTKNPQNRITAINKYFAVIDDPRSKTYIIKALDDKDSHVRAAAIDALVKIEGPKSLDYILKMLSDNDRNNVNKTKIWIKNFGPQASPIILNQLKQPGFKNKQNAVIAMGFTSDDAVIDVLGRIVIDEKDYRLRIDAIRSLAKINTTGANSYISVGLKDRVSKVKMAALENLKKDETDDFITLIEPLLYDKNQSVVIAAAKALGENKNPKAVPVLFKKLKECDEADDIVDGITDALSELGNMAFHDHYIQALEDPKQLVRFASIKAAVDSDNKKWSEPVIIYATENDMPEIKNMAVYALRNTQASKSIPKIVEAFADRDFTVRINAITTIANLPEARALEKDILPLLDDERLEVRIATIDSLPKIEAKWALDNLIKVINDNYDENTTIAACYAISKHKRNAVVAELLGQTMNSSNAKIANAATNGLVSMGSSVARKVLIDNLKSDSSDIKIRSTKALERLGDFASVGAIKNLLKDPDKDVRNQAKSSLYVLANRMDLHNKRKPYNEQFDNETP
ncbi:MAG: HEAT repeat domain-containing protein [Cyanobacteriota bacterium]